MDQGYLIVVMLLQAAQAAQGHPIKELSSSPLSVFNASIAICPLVMPCLLFSHLFSTVREPEAGSARGLLLLKLNSPFLLKFSL